MRCNVVSFPCLQELCIKSCPNLVKVSLEAVPSLKDVKLSQRGHGVLTSLVDVTSSVTKLELDDISGLTDELWRGVMENLEAVEEISIKRCNGIRYIWESEAEASKVLVKLRHLVVGDCNSLEHCSCPDSIKSLDIRNCDSIISLSFSTGGRQILDTLRISGCKKLQEKEVGGGEIIKSSMRMLQLVYIDNFPNLKSVNELGCFIHLSRLIITESFPDHELPNLTSLIHLVILDCPSMDASFPCGHWPPKLCSLNIGGLSKPISKWGPQNIPTSLDDLVLWGRPYDGDVRNFGQLSHILPSALTILGILEFEKVESVSKGLQHLTSLRRLHLQSCLKTKDLPEKLLPSLLSLEIRDCPNLKKKISKGGFYWPLVSLIPDFRT